MTPAELYSKVVGVVKEQQEYTQTLIYETLGLRWGEVNVLANTPTTITLNQPYESGVMDYMIWRQVRKLDDDQEIEVVIIPGSQSETSFQVWCPENCKFSYITTYPTINIVP